MLMFHGASLHGALGQKISSDDGTQVSPRTKMLQSSPITIPPRRHAPQEPQHMALHTKSLPTISGTHFSTTPPPTSTSAPELSTSWESPAELAAVSVLQSTLGIPLDSPTPSSSPLPTKEEFLARLHGMTFSIPTISSSAQAALAVSAHVEEADDIPTILNRVAALIIKKPTSMHEIQQTGEEIQKLLEKVELEDIDRPIDEAHRWTLLHIAALHKKSHYTNILAKEFSADPNMRDHMGRTPLFFAALVGAFGVVEVLLNNDADPALAGHSVEIGLCTPQQLLESLPFDEPSVNHQRCLALLLQPAQS